MIDAKLIAQIADAVIAELGGERANTPVASTPSPIAATAANTDIASAPSRDITGEASRAEVLVEQPFDREAIERMKTRTNARIGVGRAGARYNTQTLLTLRADHAAARDAVFLDVEPNVLDALGMFTVESRCADKNEFLTRPDLGRQLSDEAIATLREHCTMNPDVQIFASDGLSSTAVGANLPKLLPVLMDGLKTKGLSVGTPFFVKNGRVGIMERVGELLGARVVCVLLGERPGLATAESMSAYVAYNPRVGMEESRRTVISNIHRGGIPAVEAGAYLADLIKTVFDARASGVDLRRDAA